MSRHNYARLAESLARNSELTEKAWKELQGDRPSFRNQRKLRRYQAGLRLCCWLQKEMARSRE